MMNKVKNFIITYLHWFIVLGVALLCTIFLIVGTPAEDGTITLNGEKAVIDETAKEWLEEMQKEYKSSIIYSDEEIPAVIINENGEEETIEVPTIESIDGGELEERCEAEDCGRGAYIYAPTDTYQHFKDYTINKCWNVDGSFGAQCWDLSSLHSMNYTKNKRTFSTCGTGAAKGMWDCKTQNAGSEYDLVFDIYKIKVGDIAVFGGGTYGHTGVIAGPVKNGYVALLGQNQGGSACPGGGSSTNIINISIKDFLGAFHPKTYKDPEPSPTPTPTPTPTPKPVSNCKVWNVVKGDTMSKIMKTCKGYINWGEMNNYADKWISQKLNAGRSVYYGWTHGTGYGLFAGDVIQYSE